MPESGPLRPQPPAKPPLVPNFASFAAQNTWVGAAIGGPQDVPGGGYVQQFQNATAYALFGGVPHEVHGPIRDKYNQLGGPTGFLGFPTSSQAACPDEQGAFNHFTGGSIYYHPLVGAFQIGGLIELEWNSLGGPQYGYPNTDETACADGIGRFNHFTSLLPGGATAQASIYWTEPTGAHEVRGAIHSTWSRIGYETSFLGYPITDEYDSNGGRQSDFQNGSIFWTDNSGIQVLPQAFTVDAPNITFGSGISVGGHGRFQIFSDGTTHFTGYLYDDGFPSYDILVVFTVKDAQNRAYTATQTGTVRGTDSMAGSDARNFGWDLWGTSDDVRNNWPSIRSGGIGGGNASVTSDWSAKAIWDEVVAIAGLVLAIVSLALTGGPSKSQKTTDDTIYDPNTNLPPGYFDQRPNLPPI